MNDLNILKLGLDSPELFLNSKEYEYHLFNFNKDWSVINNADIEISKDGSVLTIKKFPANKPFLKTNEKDTSNTHISNILKNWKIEISGIKNLVDKNIITYYEHTTWGGPAYYGKGLSVLPMNDESPYSTLWPWDIGISRGLLKNPNENFNKYGYFVDGLNSVFNVDHFPNNSYSIWLAGMFIFTGAYKTGEMVDISNNPIILKQQGSVLPYTIEFWRLYKGSEMVYNKNKTLNNCWIKYKYATKKDKVITVDCSNTASDKYKILPEILDLNDVIVSNQGDYILWRANINNIEFWDKVRQWYDTHTISLDIWAHQLFTGSNFSGSITLNIDEHDEKGPSLFLTLRDAFYHSKILSVHLVLKNGCKFSVGLNMFRGAGSLKEITILGDAIGAQDVSGMFEYCGDLLSYPYNLINWAGRTDNRKIGKVYSNICYAFEVCGLKEIPSYNLLDRFANDNTIICDIFSALAFNGAENLTKIGPIIDCCLIDPELNGNAFNMFQCPNLVDVRIKNLNHGTWRFDGSGSGNLRNGNLPKLNVESIQYLFNNLTDLTVVVEGPTNPHKNKSNIYCPLEWLDKITTEMLNLAKNKGWVVYINNEVVTN